MTLGRRQAELVRALVAGAPVPHGFHEPHLAAARAALLDKRAGEVRRIWPELARSHGDRWRHVFAAWACGRPPMGALRDGWDFARDNPPQGAAAVELMVKEALWGYRRQAPARRRRLPAVRLRHGVLVIQIAGRVRVLGG